MTIDEAMKKCGGNKTAAAKLLGIPRSTLRDRLRKGVRPKERAGRSLTAFKKAHDKDTIIPEKIRLALKELGNSWLYESEFVRSAGVSYTDMNTYREMFDEHVVFIREDKKRVWAGTKALASQLKEYVS